MHRQNGACARGDSAIQGQERVAIAFEQHRLNVGIVDGLVTRDGGRVRATCQAGHHGLPRLRIDEQGTIAAARDRGPLRLSPDLGLRHAQYRTARSQTPCIELARGARQRDPPRLLGAHASDGGQTGRTLGQQTQQIERAACLRAGARQTFAAKRLHADDGTDHVAVHIDVARMNAVDDLVDGLVDTGVYAERQAIAGRVDVVDQAIQLGAFITHHVQHRAEHFTLERRQFVQFDQGRRDERAVPAVLGQRQSLDFVATIAQGLHVAHDGVARRGIDDRTDVDRQVLGVTHG